MEATGATLIRNLTQPQAPSSRIASVDVVRGLTLMAMIVVNNPGDWDHLYAPLEHSIWNGFTPTDFVFPNFLFLVGVSIALALSGRRCKPEAFVPTMRKVAKRGAVLFLLGVFITAFVINFDFAHLRIPGVLQRIGVVFVLCSWLFLKLSDRALAGIAFTCLAAYYLVMTFVPVPGIGAANLGPDTNLGAWLDRLVFTPAHLFRFTKTWDPEGLLTTLPSMATGLFGVLTGLVLRKEAAAGWKLRRFIGVGAVFITAGIASAYAFPINKNLWTSSYVLLTSGLSMLLLGFAYVAVDVRGSRWWTPPFLAFGANSIFAYLCSELFPTILEKIPTGSGNTVRSILYAHLCIPWFQEPRNASLAWALGLLAVFTPIFWFLRKRNIILKI
jgi:predicted acyltransferase